MTTTQDKQVYDLTVDDLKEYSAWYFPMDDSVEDELTVRPVNGAMPPDGLLLIVRTRFEDASGASFDGYLYWDPTPAVERTKPVAWIDDLCITFWNGMEGADSDYLGKVASRLPSAAWPIRFRSDRVGGLEAVSGELEGLYFIDDKGRVRCQRVE